MAGPDFTVTDGELQNEAISMILGQQVIPIMRSYGYDPDDTSGKDMLSLSSVIFANKLGLMANPFSDLHNLFKGFDSKWHNNDRNQKRIQYTGRSSPNPYTALGTEVNYYFQGVIFRIFGFSSFTGLEWVSTWKWGSGHGEVTPAIEFYFRKGWSELPGFWQQALSDYKIMIHQQERADIRIARRRETGRR